MRAASFEGRCALGGKEEGVESTEGQSKNGKNPPWFGMMVQYRKDTKTTETINESLK
jgi:osmotically-inducible protein OsmY